MRKAWPYGVGLALLLWAGPVSALECSQTTLLDDSDGGSEVLSQLSDSPAVICSVDFVATSASGSFRLVDSPDATITHAQAVTKSEGGAASAGDSRHPNYPEGRRTIFGLMARVTGGFAVVHWDD